MDLAAGVRRPGPMLHGNSNSLINSNVASVDRGHIERAPVLVSSNSLKSLKVSNWSVGRSLGPLLLLFTSGKNISDPWKKLLNLPKRSVGPS